MILPSNSELAVGTWCFRLVSPSHFALTGYVLPSRLLRTLRHNASASACLRRIHLLRQPKPAVRCKSSQRLKFLACVHLKESKSRSCSFIKSPAPSTRVTSHIRSWYAPLTSSGSLYDWWIWRVCLRGQWNIIMFWRPGFISCRETVPTNTLETAEIR